MIHAKEKNNAAAAKVQVRVIKKGGISDVGMPAVIKKVPKNEAARQMAKTIMNWVREVESRKIEENRLATARFLQM